MHFTKKPFYLKTMLFPAVCKQPRSVCLQPCASQKHSCSAAVCWGRCKDLCSTQLLILKTTLWVRITHLCTLFVVKQDEKAKKKRYVLEFYLEWRQLLMFLSYFFFFNKPPILDSWGRLSDDLGCMGMCFSRWRKMQERPTLTGWSPAS